MNKKRFVVIGLVLMLGVLPLVSPAQKTPEIEKWEKFDFGKNALQASELEKLPLQDLQRMRGIVFGKHGRVFKEQDIQNYLGERPWYKPNENFRNAMLNAMERQNLDLIREAEAKKHEHIQPGDMRFHQAHAFTEKELGDPSVADLYIMRTEIEAIHGKRFEDEPQLQAYFEDRYWYQAAAKYDPSRLTEIERANLATLAALEKKRRHLKIAPGDMLAFQSERVTEEMLTGLTLHELRLLRNEVYALRGQRFRMGWLGEHFRQQSWYTPLPAPQEPKLSSVEIRNIAIILKRENRLHEELGTKSLEPDTLNGLFVEDLVKLRNEVYARHGRVFKTKWLQGYFASFPWYKANPHFQDSSLTEMESKNLALIVKQEKEAQRMFQTEEG